MALQPCWCLHKGWGREWGWDGMGNELRLLLCPCPLGLWRGQELTTAPFFPPFSAQSASFCLSGQSVARERCQGCPTEQAPWSGSVRSNLLCLSHRWKCFSQHIQGGQRVHSNKCSSSLLPSPYFWIILIYIFQGEWPVFPLKVRQTCMCMEMFSSALERLTGCVIWETALWETAHAHD